MQMVFRIPTRTTLGAMLITLIALISLSVVSGCNIADKTLGTSAIPLTPARNLAGTWKTFAPVTFYYTSDFCSDSKETVAAADWTVTWIITAVSGDENKVNIQMNYAPSNYRRLTSTCGNLSNGWVPWVSPQFFTGTVSSSSLTINDLNNDMNYSGAFTSTSLDGTWVHWECIIYCTGEFTLTNQLKLIKQ